MKKLLSILLVVSIIFCFAACGINDEAPEEEQEAKTEKTEQKAADAEKDPKSADAKKDPKAESSEFKLAKEGVLTMGTNAEFPPYEFYENDKIVGIDAEIAKAIADKLGLEFEISDMKFDSIITSVQSGGVDIGVAGMTVTEERKKSIDFTSSYATGIQSIIVKEDSSITSPDDLPGKKIGVQLSTTGDIYATDDYGEDNIVRYNKGADAVLALVGGEIDAVIIDDQPARSFIANNKGLKILDTEYVTEEYAIAVSKDNKALKDAINIALEELIADGTVEKIVNKYIPAE